MRFWRGFTYSIAAHLALFGWFSGIATAQTIQDVPPTALQQTLPGLPPLAQPAPKTEPAPQTAPTPTLSGSQTITVDEAKKLIEAALKEKEEKEKKEAEAKKAAEPQWFAVGSDLNLKPVWSNNWLWFETANKDFRFHVGGTVQYDGAWFTADQNVMTGRNGTGEISDGVNFRRGRLRFDGTMWDVMDFVWEMEFFNGVRALDATTNTTGTFQPTVFNGPGPTDAWFAFRKLPVIGNFRIGSQKEPFSLEHLNRYQYLEFMERSYLFDAFAPTAFNNGFSPGIMMYNNWLGDRGTWWVGAFKNDFDLFGYGVGDAQYAIDGRVTLLPLWVGEGEAFWHIGAAVSHRDPINDQVQSRVRPQIRNAPFPLLPILANTGQVNGTSQTLYNIETAAVFGPVTFQAEYTASYLADATTASTGNVGTFFTQGVYAEVLCFLTGERRTWDKQNAIFNKVVPNSQFFTLKGENGYICGPGAWEVGARYSMVDLSNNGIKGGVVQSMTLGVNWYLNPNMRIQWNYDLAHRGDVGGDSDGFIQAFGMRMGMDF